MRRPPIVSSIVIAALLIGCSGSEEGMPTIPRPAKELPPGAKAFARDRTDVVDVNCSRTSDFIDEVLAAYPAVDFAARPTAACVITLEDGDILDLLRIQGDWIKVRHERYGNAP